jgi:replicative DNA helicase
MDDKLTTLQRHLGLKYEGHDFNWRESGSKRVIGLCPEHPDKNPSFNVFQYNDKTYYKCFSCGFHGGLYDFIKEGITPEQKEKYALNKQNQKRLWEAFAKMKDYLLTADTVEAVFARKYLTEKRYLDMSAVKKGNVGLIQTTGEDYGIDDLLSGENKISNYRGWIVFPHTNIKGDICRLKFREPDSKNIRTANIKGCEDEPAAFGLKSIGGRDSGDYPVSPYIYITEGEFNCLQYINTTGTGNIISAGGKDNISIKLINIFLDLDFVPVVALDQDNAGEKQLRKIYEQTPAGNREKIVYCEYGGHAPDGTINKDFDDILKNKNENGVNEVLSCFKFKTLENLEELIKEENLKKKEYIEKFIKEHVAGEGLKEIYFDKYNITPINNDRFNFKKPSEIESKKPEFYLPEILPIPQGAVTMISARGGTGKSMLSSHITLYLGNKKIKTLAWLSEDPASLSKNRLNIASTMNYIEINDEYIRITDETPLQLVIKKGKEIIINPDFYIFRNKCKDFQVIILDPLIHFYGGEENSNTEARFFMNLLTDWAKKEGKLVILVHHHAKIKENKQDARGASAFTDAVRLHYSISVNDDDNRFVKVQIEKDNWGAKQYFKSKLIQIWPEKYVSEEDKTIKGIKSQQLKSLPSADQGDIYEQFGI